MPNCRTLPPLRSIAAGITSRRSMMADPPITSTMPAPPASAPWMTSPKRGWLVRGAQIDGIAGTHRGQPAVGDGDGLVEQRRLHGGELGLDQRDLARAERVEGQDRLLARDRQAGIERGALHGERDDLDGRRHLVRLHRGVVREGRERDRLVHFVDRVDLRGIDAQDAARAGIDVDAAGERRLDAQSLGAQQRAERGGGGVLADIVRLEPRDGDGAAAGSS